MDTSRDIAIELAAAPTGDARALVRELDDLLAAAYPPEQQHGLSLDAIFMPSIRFFVARINGAAVGCGGVALFGDFAEVKRMYVRPAHRGHGVADALLARLEREALAAGIDMLRLETGERQPQALRFYARAGFRQCAAFGDYVAMPPSAVATSVFLEKRIRS